MIIRHLSVFLIILLFYSTAMGQRHCSSDEFNTRSESSINKHDDFENWLEKQINKRKTRQLTNSIAPRFSVDEVYNIPVVFHIIHHEEDVIGTKSNVSEEQVLKQLEIINQDFRRTNADTVNTPFVFESVAADTEIEFQLAQRDPDGLATTGITRTTFNYTQFNNSHADLIASIVSWDTENYLNVWVIDMSDFNFGFANFPISNLPGIANENINSDTDGVYVNYKYFGFGQTTFGDEIFYVQGRTLTHEIGHWLGLKHIWGNSLCTKDDYCSDTPLQGRASEGCPDINDRSELSCDTISMSQNYMDYTDDICMNIFTECQKNRMRTVLENSPRRKSMLTSLGAIAPEVYDLDLGISQIESPSPSNCERTIVPAVEVINFGKESINQFKITLKINSEHRDTITFDGTLLSSASTKIEFSSLIIDSIQSEFTFQILEVNESQDEQNENDSKSMKAVFPNSVVFPFSDDFSDLETSQNMWVQRTLYGEGSFWIVGDGENNEEKSSMAVFGIDDREGDFGALNYFISPTINIEEVDNAIVSFDYAYPESNGLFAPNDALYVNVSSSCGNDLGDLLFVREGTNMTTYTPIESGAIPTTEDWNSASIVLDENDLRADKLNVVFTGQNGHGNNIYLDNIYIGPARFDIGIEKIDSLHIFHCDSLVAPVVTIKNHGVDTLKSFVVNYTINNRKYRFEEMGLSLEHNESATFQHQINDIPRGSHSCFTSVLLPNGRLDENSSNNSTSINFSIQSESEAIPHLQDFSKLRTDNSWTFINTEKNHNWELHESNTQGQALFLEYFRYDNVGEKNYLISHLLDFSNTDAASLAFKVSYASNETRSDTLQVYASSVCDNPYQSLVYEKAGRELAVSPSSSYWQPSHADDWRTEKIDLSAFAGQGQVVLTFVATNDNGNNIYLDDIEIFDSALPNQKSLDQQITAYPNPSNGNFCVTLELEQKEDLTLRLVNLNGKPLMTKNIVNGFNQSIAFDMPLKDGLYFLQIIGKKNSNAVSKIIVQNSINAKSNCE